MPEAKLAPASTSMKIRKPVGPSERCGVSTAEKIIGSALLSGSRGTSPLLLSGLMRLDYTGSMGTKTAVKKAAGRKARKAPKQAPKTAKGARKARGKPAVKSEGIAKPAATASPWMKAEIEEAFRRFAAANPEPVGELNYMTPFTLLVAVVLSAQATDASVNKATPALFALADTPEKMLALGEERVRDLIKTIGLYRTKAKNLITLSRQLIECHAGEVPKTRAELEALAGVGRKTANVVLNTAFGEPTVAVDTHIFRFGNRTGLAPGKDVRAVEDKLLKFTPEEFKQ